MYGLKKIYGKLNSLNPISKKPNKVVVRAGFEHANTESVKTANVQKVERDLLKSKVNLYMRMPF